MLLVLNFFTIFFVNQNRQSLVFLTLTNIFWKFKVFENQSKYIMVQRMKKLYNIKYYYMSGTVYIRSESLQNRLRDV